MRITGRVPAGNTRHESKIYGAKAVIARSFARIHEANLKKQGILALTFLDTSNYDKIDEFDRLSLVGLEGLAPGKSIGCVLKRQDGVSFNMSLLHTLTEEQIRWFREGSFLNSMKSFRVME